MRLEVQRRAALAYQSLSDQEQRKVSIILEDLQSMDYDELLQSTKLRRLTSARRAEPFYSFRATADLRLILSFRDETCIVEDVANRAQIPGSSRRYRGR